MKFFIVLSFLLFSSFSFAKENPYSAEIFFYRGVVELSTTGGEFGEVHRSDSINIGDIIKTGERSFAIIRFPDKSTMRVEPNTEVKFEALVERIEGVSLGSSDIVLRIGRVVIDVINKSKAPVFNLKTKNISMGVRGTLFAVGVDTLTGHTDLAVHRGEVEVSRFDNPATRDVVSAGHAINLENGKNFTQPQRYKWIKNANFNVHDENLNHARSSDVQKSKRHEFRAKRKEWKRDSAKWQLRNNKWKEFQKQQAKKLADLKEKREKFRAKKKEFLVRRRALMAKRNSIVKEGIGLRKEARKLKIEERRLLGDIQKQRSGRKDPRMKIDITRRKKELKKRTRNLKGMKKELNGRRDSLLIRKKSLTNEAKNNKRIKKRSIKKKKPKLIKRSLRDKAKR